MRFLVLFWGVIGEEGRRGKAAEILKVVYQSPAADPHGSPASSRYDWLACGTPLSCRRRRRSQISGIKMALTFALLVIWQSVFLFFGTGSLVKA